MAKVKVFVHATDAEVDSRAMTLAPRTYLSQLATKKFIPYTVDGFIILGTNFSWIELKWHIHKVQNLWP